MAKWDERDPRWLVESREDGKNVGGWHWEEKNRLEWARARLAELLTGIPAAQEGGLRIARITDVVGEAMTHTRKGNKRLAIYDLKITMRWEATDAEGDQEYAGSLQLDDFSSHSEPDEYVWSATADAVGEADKRELFKGVVESLKPAVVRALQQMVAEMVKL